MKKLILSILFLVHLVTSTKMIRRLPDEDYHRMPVKSNLERFGPCVGLPGGVYCTAHADLVTDEPSELYDMIQGYSADYQMHFNRSFIIYGVCVTKSCRKFYHGDNSQAGLQNTVEACLNESLSSDYGLKTRVTKMNCYHHGQKHKTDSLDILFGSIVGTLLVINLVATLYDFFGDKSKPKNRYLIQFSARKNWRDLFTPRPSEPHIEQLRLANGMKAMTAFLVILGHATCSSMMGVENPHWFEEKLRQPLFHIVNSGNLVVLTFFLLSGFFMTYSKCSETDISWRNLPKAILLRWFRLSPVYLLVLLYSSSWFKYGSYGPFWQEHIGDEVKDCRKNFLEHALYLNNFNDNSTCHIQAWWLASDMQLHVISLILIHLAPSMKVRNWGIWLMVLVGLILPAYKVYVMDLNGNFFNNPTSHSMYFIGSKEFNEIYKRFYSNMPAFAIGMYMGNWVYHKQKENFFTGDYTKYRYLYWLILPAKLSLCMIGYFFFYGEERAPLLFRAVYSPILKTAFTIFILLYIIGALFRVEDLYRGILEMKVWEVLAKLSYPMYVIHVSLVRMHAGISHVQAFFSDGHMNQELLGLIALTIVFAAVAYILVEAPLTGLVKVVTTEAKPTKQQLNGIEKQAERKQD